MLSEDIKKTSPVLGQAGGTLNNFLFLNEIRVKLALYLCSRSCLRIVISFLVNSAAVHLPPSFSIQRDPYRPRKVWRATSPRSRFLSVLPTTITFPKLTRTLPLRII